MRKGKLKIETKKTIKPGDVCFDTVDKKCIDIIKIDDTGILTQDTCTRVARPLIKSVGLPADRFVGLFIEDEVTEEVFPLDPIQQAYVFKNESRDRLLFFTCLQGDKNIAVALTKDVNMQCAMNKLAPVADMYGEYVAAQKAIKEPAKRFNDWYFSVSV